LHLRGLLLSEEREWSKRILKIEKDVKTRKGWKEEKGKEAREGQGVWSTHFSDSSAAYAGA